MLLLSLYVDTALYKRAHAAIDLRIVNAFEEDSGTSSPNVEESCDISKATVYFQPCMTSEKHRLLDDRKEAAGPFDQMMLPLFMAVLPSVFA